MTLYRIDRIKKIFLHQKAVSSYAAFWFYLLTLLSNQVFAADQPEDSIHNLLPELIVRQTGRSPIRKEDNGSLTIKTKDILQLSRLLGEADLIDKIRTLPLAESNGDYSSGISVNGKDPGQAQYLIKHAPVIFPYRFGGLFSTFNASHFASMHFSRYSGSDLPPMLGAVFQLSPALRFNTGVEGSCSAGMTSSSMSIRAGVSDRFAFAFSGRISYIDEIYGKWLSSSDMGIKYGFHDINADAAFRIDENNIISTTFFRSADNLTYDDSNYAIDTSIKWHNTVYGIEYSHYGDLDVRFNLNHSRFADRLELEMPQMNIKAPASLSTSGADFSIRKDNIPYRMYSWNCGLKVIHSRTIPQWARLEMNDIDNATVRSSSSYPQDILTAILYGRTEWWIVDRYLKLKAETGIGWYHSKTKGHSDYSRLILTPSLSITTNLYGTGIILTAALLNQPMHRVGFSELGLATDFWIGAYNDAPIQSAFDLSAIITKRLPWWNLDIESGIFHNSVRNQVEYQGEVIETINTEYSPFSHLIVSDGYNYGAYVSLARTFGNITGDLNVSYSSGRRHDPDNRTDSWTALNSRGYVMKASAIWTDANHWTISTSFRLASGRRYTPVNALYMIGGNIAMEYGERNSTCLPLYHRLDVGATYSFFSGSKTRLRHIFNISVFNVYGHKNVEMQYFVLNSVDGRYSLKRLYSLYRFLPSISYSIEFQ